MDLMSRARSFMAGQQERLSRELAEKYGVPAEDVNDAVSSFLEDTYGPALHMAELISEEIRPVALFIGREGCAICQKSLPELEAFLKNHQELKLVKLDYSSPEGLLYHMVPPEGSGLLPLIALIFKGKIGMFFTGKCVSSQAYEIGYRDVMTEGSQNIYAL